MITPFIVYYLHKFITKRIKEKQEIKENEIETTTEKIENEKEEKEEVDIKKEEIIFQPFEIIQLTDSEEDSEVEEEKEKKNLEIKIKETSISCPFNEFKVSEAKKKPIPGSFF